MAIKSNAVRIKGGNRIFHIKLDSSYAMPTTLTIGTNCLEVGHVSNSNVKQTSSKESVKNEDGETVVSSFDYERATTAVLMQTDQQLIDWLGDDVKNSDVLEIKYCGIVEGKDMWNFRIGQVTPQFDIASPGGATAMPYEHTGYDLSSAVTISAASLASIATAFSLSTSSFFPTSEVVITASKSYAYISVS